MSPDPHRGPSSRRPPDLRYDRFRAADAARHTALMVQGFGEPAAQAEHFRHSVAPANLRAVRAGDQTAAFAAFLRMGQFYGGRRVPCLGIAGVTVDLPWRGQGIAQFLLAEILAEARAEGLAIAVLFASARPVYRRVGFEVAGFELVYEADMSALPSGRPSHALRPADRDQSPLLADLRRRQARDQNGLLDRARYQWNRLLRPRDRQIDTFVLHRDDQPRGYLALATDLMPVLVVRDWCALDGQGVTDLLRCLASYRSVFERVRWHGAPDDPLLFALPDKGWRHQLQEEWVLRIVDLDAALTARGYPKALTTELCLEIEDPLLGANGGIVRLSVAAGSGRVERLAAATGPTLRAPITALGPLYSSHRSASFLAAAGRIGGDADALARADLIFSGPKPWTAEHF